MEVALERVTDKTVRVCVLQKFSFKIQNISTVAVGTDEKGVSVRNWKEVVVTEYKDIEVDKFTNVPGFSDSGHINNNKAPEKKWE